MEIPEKLIDWLLSGNRGASSEAIVRHLTGSGLANELYRQHPYDPSDFKRCMDLLDWVPEFANRMQEMKEVSVEWFIVVDRWDELVKLYYDGCDTGTCQKLYDRMKELGL